MNLVHFPINPKGFGSWCAMRGFRDTGQAMHALITGVFGRDGFSTFRLYDNSAGGWSVYGYSSKDGQELCGLANLTAGPDLDGVVDLSSLRTKVMPCVASGIRIGFDIRCHPTRRSDKGERDAWAVSLAYGDTVSTREDVYGSWMSERLRGAASLESFRVVRVSTVKACRSGGSVKLPDATFQGTFLVEDSDSFADLLHRGVGRHRSYGMGMVLLRPADRVG